MRAEPSALRSPRNTWRTEGPTGGWILLATAVLAGCSSPTEPEGDAWVPPEAVEYAPLASYGGWWRSVLIRAVPEDAFTEPPPGVRWFRVTGGPWDDDGVQVLGLYLTDGRIFIASGFTSNEGLIKHEMLHAVLQHFRGDPDLEHTDPLFRSYDASCWAGCDPLIGPSPAPATSSDRMGGAGWVAEGSRVRKGLGFPPDRRTGPDPPCREAGRMGPGPRRWPGGAPASSETARSEGCVESLGSRMYIEDSCGWMPANPKERRSLGSHRSGR